MLPLWLECVDAGDTDDDEVGAADAVAWPTTLIVPEAIGLLGLLLMLFSVPLPVAFVVVVEEQLLSLFVLAESAIVWSVAVWDGTLGPRGVGRRL